MTPLPINFLRLGTVKSGVLWGLFALPAIFSFGAIEWLAPPRPEPPFDQQVHRIAAFLAFSPQHVAEALNLPTVFGAALLGYLVGWLANCVAISIASRRNLRGSLAVVLAAKVPRQWERDDAAEKLHAAHAKEVAEWRAVKLTGWFRYIVLRGGVLFGVTGTLLVNVALPLIMSRQVALAALPYWFVFWLLLGLALAGSHWLALRWANSSAA